ncbi:MAG: PKD domain-containing protein [Bacteroidetes bacterium]|nr:PKD domain-containing protein [Bacteroidota bacterium]
MKRFLLLAILSFCLEHVKAQSTPACALYRSLEPGYNQVTKDSLEAFTKEFISHHPTDHAARSTSYVVPVVFHIIHDGGSELLSDSIISVELSHLNEYFSASNPELSAVAHPFDTLIGNAQIEFRLAQKDPNGNCTNGIDRIYTQATYVGDDYTRINDWPRDKYLNIWLSKALYYDASYYGTLGYAFDPPVVDAAPAIDGLMLKSLMAGTNNPYLRNLSAHMAGHWLNLLHLESVCTDTINDYVADTPPMSYVNSACDTSQSICNPPVRENVQNIMTSGTCHYMFTKGQTERMWATLNAPTAQRNNISLQANLAATGTDVPNPVSCAVPIADFTSSARYICISTPVTFTDASYNAAVSSRTWTFPADATANTTSGKIATVSFALPGWHQISLQVSNANGSDQAIKTIVYVTNGYQLPTPLFEGFEYGTTAQSPWQAVNYDNNSTAFNLSTAGGHQSQSCFKLNQIDASYEGDVDILASPPLDLSTLDSTNATFSFDYSYATADPNHANDSSAQISLWVSSDCGSTWHYLYKISGQSIFNAGVQTTPYVMDPGQNWQTVTVEIPSAYRIPGINFEIRAKSGTKTNNLYIDNINIGQSTLGISLLQTRVNTMSITPNPAAYSADLLVSTNSDIRGSVVILDMEGRIVQNVYAGILPAGDKHLALRTDLLSSGVYTVQLTDGITALNRKLVKF